MLDPLKLGKKCGPKSVYSSWQLYDLDLHFLFQYLYQFISLPWPSKCKQRPTNMVPLITLCNMRTVIK